MNHRIVKVLYRVAFLCLLTWAPYEARADFLLTMASGVYQHKDGKTKVVVSSKPGAEGIFVMEGAPVSPQEFNLASTPSEGSSHLFVRFQQTDSGPRYSEVLIGNRRYVVAGNLTIRLSERTSVSIDNNNPYISVVTQGGNATQSLSIVGFFGLTEVVRGTGNSAVLLAANQLDPSVSLVIKPYVLTNGALTINDNAVTTPTIGTYVKPDNVCLHADTTILSGTQLTQLRAEKAEAARVQIFERFVVDNKKRSPLKDHLILKADPAGVILLDVKGQNVRQMATISGSISNRKVCAISDLAL